MQIWGIGQSQASPAVSGIKAAGTEAAKATSGQPIGEVHDAVTLSVEGTAAAEAAAAGDIRLDKVNAIRAAIADGSYETPEKLDIALDRLLESIG
jgi:negative regulator of flagellin synthesis FlgM